MKKRFKFPEMLTNTLPKDCYYVEPDRKDFDMILEAYTKKISGLAISLKIQYFSIEDELIRSFQYVSPINSNLSTSSVKFATIIRESSNLFEQVASLIFRKIYKSPRKLDIFHLLSLDKQLKYNSIDILCPLLQDIVKDDEGIIRPFHELQTWDQAGDIEQKHLPQWWNAYNKIKHSPNELASHSNLKNAIRSLAAAFVIITKFLGNGVVSGDLMRPEISGKETMDRLLIVRKSELFMTVNALFGYISE